MAQPKENNSISIVAEDASVNGGSPNEKRQRRVPFIGIGKKDLDAWTCIQTKRS